MLRVVKAENASCFVAFVLPSVGFFWQKKPKQCFVNWQESKTNAIKKLLYSTSYRVCHGFRLMKQDDYF